MTPRTRRMTDLQRLIGSSLVSSLAGGMILGAVPLAIVQLGGGVLAVGLASASLYAWWLASVPISALVDRSGIGPALRRFAPLRLVALLLIVAGVIVASTGQTPTAGLVTICAGTLTYGLIDVVTDSASGTLPALVVDEEAYDKAYSSLQATTRGADLVLGPILGGAAFLLSTWAPFAIAGALLVISYALLFPFFRDPRTAAPQNLEVGSSWLSETFAGLQHAARTPAILGIAITLIGVAAASEVVAVIVSPLAQVRIDSEHWVQALSVLRAVAGVFAIVISLSAPFLVKYINRGALMSAAALLGVLAPLALGLSHVWYSFGIALILAEIGEALWVPLAQGTIIRTTPRHLLARTRAAIMFITWGTIPVTSLAAGTVAASAGITPTLLIATGFAAISVAVGLPIMLRGMRTARQCSNATQTA
ncbi:MFS transporter [Brachybacterium epidermidis]|uniref:MFS transporter n=1 Tax=Brachybacterium epidermidis TaxID=2781983 RepID=UPI00398EB32D